MEIVSRNISIRDLADGYVNNYEEGVKALGGKLNVRPPYQREFVYNDKQRDLVIDTIVNFCGDILGKMYWVENEDGTYEILDGQQRTISICEYVNSGFSINERFFHNLYDEEKENILNDTLDVKIIRNGTEKEKLEFFERINVAGEKLTKQELLNINYTGTWLEDAKRRFSKTNCVAYKLGNKFLKGSPIRQEYLETTLRWISDGNIADYMSRHQHDCNANELWLYFQNVINWVTTTFAIDLNPKNYRKEMQSVEWGILFNKYGNCQYDAIQVESRVNELMSNEEVTDKKGVYEFILSGEDLNLACKLSKRTFSEKDKRTIYERQKGICPITGEYVPYNEMQADHIIPWWKGGTTTIDNLQMISKLANARKGGK